MSQPNIRIRSATPEDCEVILHHRRSMFEEMKEGSPSELDRMVKVMRPWLSEALARGTYQGFLADDGDAKVVAGGGVVILSWPASPRDPYNRRALIVNVYTEPEFRGRGVARKIMMTILEALKRQGLRSATLHASAAGRPLYESMGFTPTNEMRLRFD